MATTTTVEDSLPREVSVVVIYASCVQPSSDPVHRFDRVNRECFLRFGGYRRAGVHYEVVLNGYHRPNVGRDWGAYQWGVQRVLKRISDGELSLALGEKYWIFLNSSVFGPVGEWRHWITSLTDLLDRSNCHLAGAVMNYCTYKPVLEYFDPGHQKGYTGLPIIQSSVFAVDSRGLQAFLEHGIFALDGEYAETDKERIILDKECRASWVMIYSERSSIKCLLEEFNEVDWSDQQTWRTRPLGIPCGINGDVQYPGAYRGRTLTELDVPFLKHSASRSVIPSAEWFHKCFTVTGPRYGPISVASNTSVSSGEEEPGEELVKQAQQKQLNA